MQKEPHQTEYSSHYEKFPATGEVRCIDDEIPFEIPDTWEWVRIKSIFFTTSGGTPIKGHPEYYANGTIPWVKSGELCDKYLYNAETFITEEALKHSSAKYFPVDTVAVAMYGATIGKTSIFKEKLTTNQAICGIFPNGYIVPEYLYYFIQEKTHDYLSIAFGSGQPNISQEKIKDTIIPIPPQSEQYRIVEVLNLLIPKIEEYNTAQSQLNTLNSEIKSILKKSILQEAIQGRLVEQCEADEPASKLLERIQEEKKQLVKQGKLKAKDLTNSHIFRGDDNKYYEKCGNTTTCIDDEIPFEIPNTWEWCRLGQVVQINPKNKAEDDVEAAFIPMELIDATYYSSYSYSIKKWKEIKNGFTHLADGDIAFAKITPCFQNRKSMILKDLPNSIGAGTTELKVLRPYANTINDFYLLFFLESTYFIEQATFKGTANQQRIISGYVENKMFPLPPLAEQQRIASKVEQALASIMSR